MMSEHLVIWCAGHGCPEMFVGPPRDIDERTATRRAWTETTAAQAIAAGWLRIIPPASRRNPCRREEWYCPRCRTDRPARPDPAPIEIPADCPF